MNQEKIGQVIKDIRKKHNLTQADFANKYNVTYQAVSKWENGKNLPDISLIKKICNDFNINLNNLLEGEYLQEQTINKTKILIKDIRSVELTTNPFTSTSLSRYKININYRKYDLATVAPKDREGFIQLLQQKNNSIKIR